MKLTFFIHHGFYFKILLIEVDDKTDFRFHLPPAAVLLQYHHQNTLLQYI